MNQPPAYLDMVPVEIWAACWVYCTARQLRRISLVCHLFRSISLPFLLQHQTFDIAVLVAGLDRDNWIDCVRHLHRTAVRLDGLSASPFIPLVRSWAVTFGSAISMSLQYPGIKHIGFVDAMHERVCRTFCTTLNLYRNLEALHITGWKIDTAMWETLLALPKLEDLRLFRGCEIVTRDVGNGTTAEVPSRILSPTMLRSINLDNCSLLLHGFSGRRLDNLAHLTIGFVRDFGLFFRFVEQCPQLESLAIMSLNRHSVPHPLRPTSLPFLHSLTGPAILVCLLAPNRPISRAGIVVRGRLTRDELMSACVALSHSSVPIHTLALPVMPRSSPIIGFLSDIMSLLPQTKELSLGIEGVAREGCCLVRPLHQGKPEVDMQLPKLCDTEAFDALPAEELSDDETDDHHPILLLSEEFSYSTDNKSRWTYSLELVLEWIVGGSISLPSDLEILRLDARGLECELELPKQHQALALLGARWPHLREVQFGFRACTWRRADRLWKSDGKSPVRIVPDTHGATPTSVTSQWPGTEGI
ncbi:hypothetical protein DFH08DRAFT_1082373 [Mycena albidolilacea]|uniref:F-box domain-containing protein n=1 Tax=Mycena albidolilacea TaxID=1033008 RepID=A0AAD6ZU23_9AGAR|nr:hypothetical protein DFH08DRAFT_1082373 [Mycena albidolilacea]